MRTGIVTVPLDYGRCPKWLFERMKKLSRGIVLAIVEEFGEDELLRRLADPVWFQSLGCIIGFDWNSSGLTTTTLAALKEGLKGLERDLGIFICGGKGKTSRRTPDQIKNWGENLLFSDEEIDRLVYASKMAAKVDSSLLQDGFQIYHHNLIFTRERKWAVVQQGMDTSLQKARRYHWLSSNLQQSQSDGDFIEEPHSGIISDARVKPLNLTAKESKKNRSISTELIKEEPKTFLKDIKLISKKSDYLMKQKRIPGFAEVELKNIEFHQHPVLKEKFDLGRLKKIVEKAHFLRPKSFEQLLSTKGVGPKTIRALSLVSELIYGAKPSYEDPARYSFAHGGKDGTPYFPRALEMDQTIRILEKGIKKSKVSNREKIEAKERLVNTFLDKSA